MPRRLAAITGADVVWLLELQFGGRTYRWATDHIRLTNADSETLDFAGGLQLSNFSESLDRFTYTADAQSIALEVNFTEINVAEYVARGFQLAAITGEVSLVQTVNGTAQQTYEQRSIIMRGSVADAQFGHPDRPDGYMSFSLEGALVEDSGTFQKFTDVVSEDKFGSLTSWPNDNPHDGKPIPIVFGRPGRFRKADSDGRVTNTAGSPAYILTLAGGSGGTQVSSLVIANHQVLATTVRTKTERDAETQATFFAIAGDGVPYSFTDMGDIDGTGTNTGLTSAELEERVWWIGWTRSGGYALENPYHKGQGLTGGGDLSRWALSYSTMPVDWGAWQAVSDTLNLYEFSGYISDLETRPWDWLQEIWRLLPISVRRGVNGIYPVLHDLGMIANQAIKITTGPDFSRAGPAQLEGSLSDIFNRIEFSHAYSGRDNEPRTYSAIGNYEGYTKEPEAVSSAITVRSEHRYGSRLKQEESAYVYQRSTADKICYDMARRHSLIAKTIQYRADRSFVWIELGDVLAITDVDLKYTDQVCQVIARGWDGDSWIFTLVFDEDPHRDTQST